MKHRNSARLVVWAALALPTLAFAHPGHGAEDGTTLAVAMLVGAAVGVVGIYRGAVKARATRSRTSPAASAPARPSTSSR